MIRRREEDGERIHPHPGMPTGTATVARLASRDAWVEWEGGGEERGTVLGTWRGRIGESVEARLLVGASGGVTALRAYVAGECVTFWHGRVYLGGSTSACPACPVLAMVRGVAMDGSGGKGGAQHVREAAGAPNVALAYSGALYATRPISRGEELFMVYGETFIIDGVRSPTVGAGASAAARRGTIRSFPLGRGSGRFGGFVSYVTGTTPAGDRVVFVEEILTTSEVRGQDLKGGQ